MGTKTNPDTFDCYARALDDEPIFTLLGRDPQAPALLRLWADVRRREVILGARDEDDLRMCSAAEESADQMEEWRKVNDGTWRIPEARRATYADDNTVNKDGTDA